MEKDLDEAIKGVQEYLNSKLPDFSGKFEVIAPLPSRDWHLQIERVPEEPSAPREFVISFLFHDEAALGEFREAIQRELRAIVGTDLAARETEYWCPASVDELLFGNRAAARDLINADQLQVQKLRGNNVNVVIVDRGLDRQSIGANFGGGWSHTNPYTGAVQLPGMTRGDDARHGIMMARNILNLAPDARSIRSTSDPAAHLGH
jgi:hypothetical protein